MEQHTSDGTVGLEEEQTEAGIFRSAQIGDQKNREAELEAVHQTVTNAKARWAVPIVRQSQTGPQHPRWLDDFRI